MSLKSIVAMLSLSIFVSNKWYRVTLGSYVLTITDSELCKQKANPSVWNAVGQSDTYVINNEGSNYQKKYLAVSKDLCLFETVQVRPWTSQPYNQVYNNSVACAEFH